MVPVTASHHGAVTLQPFSQREITSKRCDARMSLHGKVCMMEGDSNKRRMGAFGAHRVSEFSYLLTAVAHSYIR